MRLLMAGLALLLVPGLARAECSCTCVRGKPQALCTPPALVAPICQQVCIDRIEQSLGTMSLPGGGGGGGAASGAAGAAGGGNADVAAAVRAYLGR